MMKFAGVDLGEPEGSEVGAWIAENIHPERLFPLAYRAWPGQLSSGPILNITPEEPRAVRISSLFWPWSASRFARAHYVVSTAQLNRIRLAVIAGGKLQSASLIVSDGTNSISTLMWMLPSVPLSKAAPGLGLYLLTLVDDRYWWWGQSLNLTATTWTDMYAQIGTNLGITITVDTVSSNYGTPTIDYATGARPLPAIFDTVAFSVQQRVVRTLDGKVRAMNYSTAKATVTANLAKAFNPYAGGAFDFNPRT